jgi:hypothetical protein
MTYYIILRTYLFFNISTIDLKHLEYCNFPVGEMNDQFQVPVTSNSLGGGGRGGGILVRGPEWVSEPTAFLCIFIFRGRTF